MGRHGVGFTPKNTMDGGSTSDIITSLPFNVIENILGCLTIQDAARTSVLSKKWRYIWTTLPKIVFDDPSCTGSVMRETSDKIVLTLYKVLILHHGPIIKFELSLTALESCSEIDQLIYFLSNDGIRELTLKISKGEIYKLLSALFSCLQLEYLELYSCVFKPPLWFKGFTNLISLRLFDVVIADALLSNLISSCPQLISLMLYISSSSNCIEIVAPNLKFLGCQGSFRSICLRNTSCLTEVIVFFNELRTQLELNEGEILESSMLLSCVPVIEVVELDYRYVKCMAASGLPDMVTTTFNHLKYIVLYDICFVQPDEMFFLLWLLRSSPKLKEIDIHAFHCASAAAVVAEPDLVLFDVQGWSDVSFNDLCKVTMHSISGTKPEMEFLKHMLSKSPMLKTMEIKLESKGIAEKLRIVMELTGFRRVSPHAVITF